MCSYQKRVSSVVDRLSKPKVQYPCNDENMKTCANTTKRRTLQVLQPSATDERQLAGRPVNVGKESFRKPQTVKAQRENHIVKRKRQVKDACCQTISEEAQRIMTVPPKYFEDLAESRRVALEEALEENFELHSKLAGLEEKMEEVKREAVRCLEEQAKQFQEVIAQLQVDAAGGGDDSDGESSCSDDADRSIANPEEERSYSDESDNEVSSHSPQQQQQSPSIMTPSHGDTDDVSDQCYYTPACPSP